jgi:hypothetical protein
MPKKTPTANEFKQELRFRSARLEEIEGVLPDGQPVVATVKVDGELEVWEADVAAGHFAMVNRNGRERHVSWIATAVLGALRKKGIQSARGAGELYVRERPTGTGRTRKGKPVQWPLMEFGPAMGKIKTDTKPDTPEDRQKGFRLAVFDLFELDGRTLWGKVPYAERFALLFDLFKGSTGYVHPVIGQTNVTEADPVKALWDKHVLEEGYEGLVIRANHTIKVKPVHTIDVAVIGYVPGAGKHQGRMGALVTAFQHWDGTFLEAGKVGTGFTDAEREWWRNHMKPATLAPQKGGHSHTIGAEKSGTPMRPTHVIEVAAERFTEPKVRSWRWTGRRWEFAGFKDGAVAQKPRFVRRRPDKRVTPYDLRLSQIPGFVSDFRNAVVPDPTTDRETFSYLVSEMRDDLARFSNYKGFGMNPDDFEDVYQDTATKALEMWQRLVEAEPGVVPTGAPRPGAKLFNWLARIFEYRWIDIGRKRARQAGKIKQLEFFSPERARRAKQTRRNPRRKRKVRT